jgi:patatin-like phospholipase/acyl hydrolase
MAVGDASDSAAEEIVRHHATGRIDRRDAIRRLGFLGLGSAVASSLLGAPDSLADSSSQKPPFRILSFVGGGLRGIASAKMLLQLAKRHPYLVAQADLLAGTSVGATIVSLLVAGQSPHEIYSGLTTGGTTLLGDPKTDPAKPAFSIDDVAARQRELHPFNPRLRELQQKVLFTSFHVGGGPGRSWHTVLFNNLSKSTNAETRLVDAVVSSGAMPGQLGSWKGHIDGAFVNHDPTLAAIALAVNEGVALQDITAICFGTGFMANWIRSDTHAWGAYQWQNGDDNPADNTPPLLVNGTDSPILNAMLNGTSTNFTPQLCGMMLGDRYAYLNPVLDRYIAEDDTNPNDLAYMESQSAKVDISQASSVVDKYWY